MTHETIHELMAEIDEKVEHLKKLINYQEEPELFEEVSSAQKHLATLVDHPFENDAERDLEIEAIKKAND